MSTTRPSYGTAQIRAQDLAEHDVFRDEKAAWREVLSVWTDDTKEEALAHHRADQAELRMIEQHLVGHGTHVLVRYLVEEESISVGQIADSLVPLRACSLVTIQAPNGEIAVPEHTHRRAL